MKRFLKSLTVFLAVILSAFLFACGEKTTFADYEQAVKIIVQTDEEQTLKEYMDGLVLTGELEYTAENGMITSINGVSNTDKYWMLYTDDSENANTAYGVKYEGKAYYSANWGAEALEVKDGYTYVWVYQGF